MSYYGKVIKPVYFEVSNEDASNLSVSVNEEDNPCNANINGYFTKNEINNRKNTNSLILIDEPGSDGKANVISTDTANDFVEEALVNTRDLDSIIANMKYTLFNEFIAAVDMNVVTILHSEFDAFVEQYVLKDKVNEYKEAKSVLTFRIFRFDNLTSLSDLFDYIYENKAPYNEFVINSKSNLVAYDVILQAAELFNTYLYNIMMADVLDYRRFCIETGSITDKDNDVSDYTCYALVYSLLQSVAKGCVEHIYEMAQMNAKFLATKIIHFAKTLKTI